MTTKHAMKQMMAIGLQRDEARHNISVWRCNGISNFDGYRCWWDAVWKQLNAEQRLLIAIFGWREGLKKYFKQEKYTVRRRTVNLAKSR